MVIEMDVQITGDSIKIFQDKTRIITGKVNDNVNYSVNWKDFPPDIINGAPTTVYAIEDATITIPGSDYRTDFNEDHDNVWVTGLPPGSSQNYNKNNDSVDINLPNNWDDDISATLHFRDKAGNEVTHNVYFDVTPVNDAPVPNVPDQTVSSSPVTINLNNYVSDPDNSPNDMTWSASDYNNGLVQIDIDPTTNMATLTRVGGSGSTSVMWTAHDGQDSGFNNANITLEQLAKLLTMQLFDPSEKEVWKNQPFNLIVGGQTVSLTSNNDGEATYATNETSGTVETDNDGTVRKTIQEFYNFGGDATLVVPVVGNEFLQQDVAEIQSKKRDVALLTQYHPRFFESGSGGVKKLRIVYYNPDMTGTNFEDFVNQIKDWNTNYYKKMTRGKYNYEVPQIGHNVFFSMKDDLQGEMDLRDSLWTANQLPNDAAVYWLKSHHGLNTTGSVRHNSKTEGDNSLIEEGL